MVRVWGKRDATRSVFEDRVQGGCMHWGGSGAGLGWGEGRPMQSSEAASGSKPSDPALSVHLPELKPRLEGHCPVPTSVGCCRKCSLPITRGGFRAVGWATSRGFLRYRAACCANFLEAAFLKIYLSIWKREREISTSWFTLPNYATARAGLG